MNAHRRSRDHSVRRLSARSLVSIGALAICGVVLASGCSTGVVGEPVAVSGSPPGPSRGSSSDLERLSLTPSDFPSSYPATRLRSEQAGQALADLSGHAPGTAVTPSSCEPPQISAGSGESVVVVGMSTSGGSLTVVTTRSQSPLSDLRAQVLRCGFYRADIGGVSAAVTTQLLPPSPVDSEQSLAFRRITRSGQAPVTLTQSITLLAAQNNGIRVYASYLSFSGARPDGVALDAIFTKAVQKSRSG